MRIHGGYGYSQEFVVERLTATHPCSSSGRLERDPAARHRATAPRAPRARLMDFAVPEELNEIPHGRGRALLTVPGRVLARPRARPLSRGVRRRADRERLACSADSGGVRRRQLSLTAASVILEEINASGGNAARYAQMYTMGTILRHGSEAQKQRYLPAIASGELRLQAFGVTVEPTVGSDTTHIQTMAEHADGGYRVTGQKIWTSRAQHSDLMLLLARTTPLEDVEKRTEVLSTFIDMKQALEAGTMTIRPIKTLMNHATTEIFFDGVEIPEDALVGEEGKGFASILDGMNAERILIAAECIGDGKWFVERGYDLRLGAGFRPADRHEPGRPVPDRTCARGDRGSGSRPLQGGPAIRAGRALRRGGEHGQAARLRGFLASRKRVSDTHGGFTAEEYDVERKFRETRPTRSPPCRTTSSSRTSASTSSNAAVVLISL